MNAPVTKPHPLERIDRPVDVTNAAEFPEFALALEHARRLKERKQTNA